MNYFTIAATILIVTFSVHNGVTHEGHDHYTGCELDGEIRLEEGKCVMNAEGCKENGEVIRVPSGQKIKLSCDAVPQGTKELPARAGCPGPNECANDEQGDGTYDYSDNITWILTMDWGDSEAGDVISVQRQINKRVRHQEERGKGLK